MICFRLAGWVFVGEIVLDHSQMYRVLLRLHCTGSCRAQPNPLFGCMVAALLRAASVPLTRLRISLVCFLRPGERAMVRVVCCDCLVACGCQGLHGLRNVVGVGRNFIKRVSQVFLSRMRDTCMEYHILSTMGRHAASMCSPT